MIEPNDFFGPVRALGLEKYVAELENYGYTVVPPEHVATGEFVERVTDAVLRVIEERTGVKHVLHANGDVGQYNCEYRLAQNQFELWYLLFEDPVFEDWLENPTLAAMTEYCMRGQGQLSSMMAFVKWRSADELTGLTHRLHCDAHPASSPEGALPFSHNLVVNTALCLTHYSHDDGAIVMVPGSHRRGRVPTPGEAAEEAVAVEAEVGSLIVWLGNTWHGALPKRTDGLRLCLNAYFGHRALKTQERYQTAVPDEMLARHSARFARLLGADDPMGWDKHGPSALATSRYIDKTADAATSTSR